MTNEALHRKIIHYSIPIAILIISVLIMQGAIYNLGSQKNRNDTLTYKNSLQKDIQSGQWDNAAHDLNNLKKSWRKLVLILEFHSEKDAIDGIDVSLGRLEGLIAARDKAGAMAELGEISEHLSNLTS